MPPTLPKAFSAWLLKTNTSILMDTKPEILLQFLIGIKIFHSYSNRAPQDIYQMYTHVMY